MTDKMEVDNMEVNMEVVPASSSGTVSASSSSSEKLDLTELGLDELSGQMKDSCHGFIRIEILRWQKPTPLYGRG